MLQKLLHIVHWEIKQTIIADNYIEKQRADYEVWKAAWEKAKKQDHTKSTVKKVQKNVDSKDNK